MAIASDVVFAIGVSGAAASKAKLLGIGAAVLALGRRAATTLKGMEDFRRAFRRLEVDIGAADQATAGLIDTLDLVRNANKLTAGGLKPTAQELKNLAVLAADFAKKTGVEATQAFTELTNAMAGGRTFTLKKYGLVLGENIDKTVTWRKAMEQIGPLVEGVTIEVEDMGERLFALNNNLDTATALIYNAAASGNELAGVLDPINSHLGRFNKFLADYPKVAGDFITATNAMKLAGHSLMSLVIAPGPGMFDRLSDSIDSMGQSMVDAAIDAKVLRVEQQRLQGVAAEAEAFAQEQGLTDADIAADEAFLGGATSQMDAAALAKAAAEGKFTTAAPTKKTKTTGGGGGKKKPSGPTAAEIEEQRLAELEEITGAGIGGPLMGTTAAEQLSLAEMGIGPPTEEQVQRTQIELELERQLWETRHAALDSVIANREASLTFAEQFGNAWMANLQGVTSGAIAANAAFSVMRGTVAQMITSIVMQERVTLSAIASMVRNIAMGAAIESTVLGIMETVKAAVAAAKPFGVGAFLAARHTAAAGVAFAQAAALSALAAGAHALAKRGGGKTVSKPAGGGGSVGSGGGGGGGGAVGGGAVGGGGGTQKIVIDMTVDLDGETVHKKMVEHDGIASRDGRQTLMGG